MSNYDVAVDALAVQKQRYVADLERRLRESEEARLTAEREWGALETHTLAINDALLVAEAALTAKDEEIARLTQALDLTNTALDRALAGRPVRNADEILSANGGLLARIETPPQP